MTQPDLLPGRATPAGTLAQLTLRGIPEAARRTVPGLQWSLSALGFGGYRIHPQVAAHADALRRALRAGINVIDTASNYADGGSERLAGHVLREAIANGESAREGVVVVTKGGYVQGQTLDEARRRQAQGKPWRDAITVSDDCWYCIHPDFITHQIEASRQRLGLAHIDVYLLHNPEYFLEAGGGPAAAQREALWDRLAAAFMALEEAAARGVIGCYGVSSNGFPMAADRPGHLSLADVREAAVEAAVEVHGSGTKPSLRFIELPFNLVESGAALTENTPCDGKVVPVLEAARRWGLAVLANRPLNALRAGELLRLAEPAVASDIDPEEAVRRSLGRLAETEVALWRTVQAWPRRPRRPPTVASTVLRLWPDLAGREQWQQVFLGHVAPLVRAAIGEIDEACPETERSSWLPVRANYLDTVRDVDRDMTLVGALRDARRVRPVSERVVAALGAQADGLLFQEQALRVALHTPGIGCVLNGMRYEAYVDAALRVLRAAPLDPACVMKLLVGLAA